MIPNKLKYTLKGSCINRYKIEPIESIKENIIAVIDGEDLARELVFRWNAFNKLNEVENLIHTSSEKLYELRDGEI